MNGVHGVGEHALGLVVGEHRVAPGLSLSRLLMEAQHVQEDQQLLGLATQLHAQVNLVSLQAIRKRYNTMW